MRTIVLLQLSAVLAVMGTTVASAQTYPNRPLRIVTSGVGWTQCEGGPKAEIRAGDVIWCPCRRRHWHGATPTTSMTHVAIAEALEGKSVEWMEPVTDEQYLAGPVQTD